MNLFSKKFTYITLFSIVTVLTTGCVEEKKANAEPTKNSQSEKAYEAANSIQFTDNAEIENIKRRVELTSQPGLLGYILLFNEMGQPVIYEAVKGKVTSGSKRLTRSYDIFKWDYGNFRGDKDLPAASDEGTWGSSGEYIFYWNQSGEYRQWNGRYFYSDRPIRLNPTALPVILTEAAESAVQPSTQNTTGNK